MRLSILGLLLPAWLMLAACEAAAQADSSTYELSPHVRSDATVPPALLTPEESDRLAFEQAVSAGTNSALILFLARETQNPWIEEARRLLALRRTPDAAGAAAIAGPDAEVIRTFDAARLSGGPAAWDAFLSQHGTHPLAAEARRLRGD